MANRRAVVDVSDFGHGMTMLQHCLARAMYSPWEAWWLTLPAPGLPPPSLVAVL